MMQWKSSNKNRPNLATSVAQVFQQEEETDEKYELEGACLWNKKVGEWKSKGKRQNETSKQTRQRLYDEGARLVEEERFWEAINNWNEALAECDVEGEIGSTKTPLNGGEKMNGDLSTATQASVNPSDNASTTLLSNSDDPTNSTHGHPKNCPTEESDNNFINCKLENTDLNSPVNEPHAEDELVIFKANILEMKAQVLMQLHEIHPAVQTCEEVVKLRPKWPEGYQTLGRCYLGTGDVQKALKTFQLAYHLNPNLKEIYDEDICWAQELLKKQEEVRAKDIDLDALWKNAEETRMRVEKEERENPAQKTGHMIEDSENNLNHVSEEPDQETEMKDVDDTEMMEGVD